jgi:prophage tail gpP-like protein
LPTTRDPNDLTVTGDDVVSIKLTANGPDALAYEVAICESYEVKISVMTQPSAFTLRLGWSDTARELLQLAIPGSLFELSVSGVLIQSGIIDSRGVPSSDSTVVEIKGRDFMRKLMNCHVEEDIEFKEKTYYDLTRHVMNIVGLEKHELVAGNGANRRAVTGTNLEAVKTEDQVRVIETGLPSPGGSKLEFKSLKARVGERWYDWLQDKYKLAGMFLWCAGDGKFILATPQPSVLPLYPLVRQRGVARNTVNIISHTFRDDCTNRHAQYIVYGRFGHGKAGRNKITGEYVDSEMVLRGFTDVITYHDPDVATTEQAEHLAKRYASEERRAGWNLDYTVAGHRVPSLFGDVAIWGPDTTAQVQDDELGIEGDHYIESVTFAMNPQKTTKIELIRPEDLLYLAEMNPEAKKKASGALSATKDASSKKEAAQQDPAAEPNDGDISWKWDADAHKPIPGYPGSKLNFS